MTADNLVLNFDIDDDYEYDISVRLRELIGAFRQIANDAPEGSAIRRGAEFAVDMIMNGPLGEVIK